MKKSALILTIAVLAIVGASMASAATSKPSMTTQSKAKMALVHINTASLKQLETLPGISPRIANTIIKNRSYKNAKDLERKVKAITPGEWSRIRGEVTFS